MPHGNLAGFATLVEEPQAVLVAGVVEVAHAEPGDRADSGRRVDQHGNDGPVSKSDDVAGVDTRQKRPGLFDRDFGRLPSITW